MNDKIIINTILKIHFTIVSALSFIFFTLSLLFILLQNGFYVQNISLPNLQVKKLYIKWNEKLNISIQEVKIIKNSKKTSNTFSIKETDKLFKILFLFDNWFEQIKINKISINDIQGSFKYIESQKGFLVASSKDFSFKSSFFFESHLFNAKIEKFHHNKHNINVNGNIIYDGYKNMELVSSLNIDINNDIKLKAYAISNSQRTLYKINSNKNIKSIKHTIEMFNMPKEVKYWAYDAIKMTDIELKSFYGWLDYDNLADAYKKIYIKAVANNLSYTYNKKLQPVTTNYTELKFKNGVLYIRPKDAYQYGFNLNKSWLKIDFTKKEELLTLFLLFKGQVTKDLIYLLNTYNIKLPFLQNSGNVDTNLKIEVGLRNIDVTAKGDFFTKEANFNYLGLDLDIYNAHVFLDNYDVSIKNMHSKYKDIATADVNVEFNAKKSEGTIDFKVQQVDFKEIGLSLKKADKPLQVNYKISNEQDIINAESSTWLFKNKDLKVENISMPFDLKKLVAQIPTTHVNVDNFASAYVSGTFALKPIRADLDVDILKFLLNNVKMEQSSASFKVNYNKKFILLSNDKIRLNANDLDYILDNLVIELDQEKFRVLNSNIQIKDLADAKFKAKYLFNDNIGTIKLKKLNFKNKDLGEIFSSNDAINLDVNVSKGTTKVRAKEYDANFILQDKGWILKFNSISRISKKSKLLQDNNITNGNFSLFKNFKNKNIEFLANTKYPYQFLSTKDSPIKNYAIKGSIDEETKNILFNINDLVDVTIDKDLNIYAKNTGINVDAMLNYFNDRNSTSSSTKNIIFNANKCFLYISKDRYVISDTINLQYFNNIVSAQLKHKKGNAGFELKDKKFYLYGDNFNDEFMDNLFALSKFKGGALSFSMTGTIQEYDGLMYVKDTTVIDYKVLNNILAFVNTIPSLVTFSVPGYSKNGLEVSSAYMNFHVKDDILNFTDISLDSKEIDIIGKGTASYKHNNIDVDLNLKTDLGSSVSKIPVVGYILLGKDNISTSMKISGKLNDPEVKSLIAKDIAVAPLNIIKRTLLLPFHLFEDDKNKKEEK
jgi:hypothetical protein